MLRYKHIQVDEKVVNNLSFKESLWLVRKDKDSY